VKIRTITRVALAAGLAAAGLGVAAPVARADLDAGADGIQLVQCSGSELIASLNPTLKDGDATAHYARYAKSTAKRSDGTKTVLGSPIPADGTTCSVDAGIRADQLAQDVKYVLDNQSNGNATLTLAGFAASLSGSAQCDSSQANQVGINDYPTGYPLQGKITLKFAELLPSGAPIQIQAYNRIYTDDVNDPGVYHVVGTVIKGPGLGGRLTTAFGFFPTDSTKNVNVLLGCTDGVSGNASAAELWITGTDSAIDADADTEKFVVTLSDDKASELVPGP
jgi:hypothetical protein